MSARLTPVAESALRRALDRADAVAMPGVIDAGVNLPRSSVHALFAELDALRDRLERAERAPAVSRDAGEALYAALEELGVADDLDSAAVERAAVHVERYGERREEAGAEGEREQRAIERRGGPER